ncbi:MAG: ABC transporter substrate-binding protein [Candidatus Zipacnadales bacterium]
MNSRLRSEYQRYHHRTAVVGAAVLLFLVALSLPRAGGVVSRTIASEAPTISLQVWRYHFPGETAFLNNLGTAYQQRTKRKIEIWQDEWRECARKVQRWVEDSAGHYAPDMVIIPEEQLPSVLGRAYSLEGQFPHVFLEALGPRLLGQCRIEGVLVALPWMIAPRALYYNATLLEERGISPPTTPEELLAAAKTVADPPAHYGLAFPGATSPDFFLTFFRSFGGVLFGEDSRLALNSEAGLRTLELLVELTMARSTQPEVLTWDDMELADLFCKGRVAMIIERPWLLREVQANPPGFEVGVRPVPTIVGGMGHLRMDCVIIFDTARDIDACVQFLQFALSCDVQQSLAALGVVPVHEGAARALPKGPGWKVFQQALRTSCGPSPATWTQVASVIDKLVYLTLSGRATPAEALQNIGLDFVDEPDYLRFGLPSPRPKELRPSVEKP